LSLGRDAGLGIGKPASGIQSFLLCSLGSGTKRSSSRSTFAPRLTHALLTASLDALTFSSNVGVKARRFGFHFFLGALLGFPAFMAAVRAVLRAIATACFCGLPAFISFEMFEEMDFCE
jgi:hypothetical protein